MKNIIICKLYLHFFGASRFLCRTLRHPRDLKGLKKCRNEKMALPQILNASGNAHKEKRIHIDKRQMDYLNLIVIIENINLTTDIKHVKHVAWQRQTPIIGFHRATRSDN